MRDEVRRVRSEPPQEPLLKRRRRVRITARYEPIEGRLAEVQAELVVEGRLRRRAAAADEQRDGEVKRRAS